jgi:prepilin-type N-terminal cleavage/methylation domain-containing protein
MKIRTHHRGRRPRQGFTLAELLVATTLLSIVMSSVYFLFNTSLRSWRIVESGFDAHLEARAFMSIFSQEYGNVVLRAGHLFEGKDDTVTMFVVAQPEDLEEGQSRRLMRVEYSYNRGKNEVIREEAFVESGLPPPPPPSDKQEVKHEERMKFGKKHRTVLVNNATAFNIRYVWVPLREDWDPKTPPEPEPPIYKDVHKPRWGFPQAVEITLEVTNPKDPEDRYTVTSTFPLRGPMNRVTRKWLDTMMGEKP